MLLEENKLLDITDYPKALRSMVPLASGMAFMGRRAVRSVLMGEFLYEGRGRVLSTGTVGKRLVFPKDDPRGIRIAKNAIGYFLAAPVPRSTALWPWPSSLTKPAGSGS